MRENLEQIHGTRTEFTGIFVRFGHKGGFKGYSKRTVLLKDIKCTSNKKIYADHLWFNLTYGFAKIDLQEGDMLSFEARVKEYHKGYQGNREDIQWIKPIERDYKLNHPTKVRLLKRKGAAKHPKSKSLIPLEEFL